MGYAVGKLAQCLGIPYVQPIWENAITGLVVDFKFGEGIHRRSRWEDLNEIFQNAVKQGYQSQKRATLTEPEVRRIKEEQASDFGCLEHGGANDDGTPFCERMPDIWEYANGRDVEVRASEEAGTSEEHLDNFNALRNLQTLDMSDGRPPERRTPGEQCSRQDTVPEEGSSIGALRYVSPLNNLRVHNTIDGQYAIRSRIVDTLHMRPPRQLPPSDQQGNGQTTRGQTFYEYSWTGM